MINYRYLIYNCIGLTRLFIFKIVLWVICFAINPFSTEGQVYFQQRTNYKIDVLLDDERHMLNGNIQIDYYNNSPDTLSSILFHLWPNAYKDESTALSEQLVQNGSSKLFYADDEQRGFIDSLRFTVNDKWVMPVYDYNGFADICEVPLINPLLPGAMVTVKTPFRVKIPDANFSRMGHIDQSYFITQWYPKPAVYDRYGWHAMPYLDQGEFYSEFGRFEVRITIPSNYVIGGSGVIQEPEEHKWLKEKNDLYRNNRTVNDSLLFPESDSILKTVTFIQDSIHDFAWFADKRYHVLIDEFILDSSNKPVTTYTLFTSKRREIWETGPEIVKNTIRFFSEKVGNYPYSVFTVVDGTIMAGGGMEYPLATILNSPSSQKTFETTLIHEVIHSWFYGILANNERKHAWMDEGLTTYYENYYQKLLNKSADSIADKTEGGSALLLRKAFGISDVSDSTVNNYFYLFGSFNNGDQPISTPSEEFTYFNYGAVLYAKAPLALTFLSDYLGDSVFTSCMQQYFDTWKFKHPYPEDIQKVFEETSGKDLSWFFDDMFNSNRGSKNKVKSLSDNENSILISHKSGIHIPTKIENENGQYTWSDVVRDTVHQKLEFETTQNYYLNRNYKILLKSKHEAFSQGKATGGFPKIKLGFIPHINDKPGTETVYILPVPAWNRYNNFMAGLLFTNMNWVPGNFEFSILPLYDFSNNKVAGVFNIEYHHWPFTGPFSEITMGMEGKRFAYDTPDLALGDPEDFYNYSKVNPFINFKIRKKQPRSTLQHSILLKNTWLWLDEVDYTLSDNVYVKSYGTSELVFNEVNYKITNTRNIDPYNISLSVQQGDEYVKAAVELNYKLSYKRFNKGIDVRIFAGTFLENNNSQRNYNFRMAGWNGAQDYLYDEIYFGRSDDHGLWDNQFLIKEGGFKTPTFLGQSNDWIAALNVSVDLPLPIPISIFADVGAYEGINVLFDDLNNKIMYDVGISVKPIKDVLEIYFPIFLSDDIERVNKTNNIKFADQIRFVFNIKNITPLKLRNRAIDSFQ